MILPAESRFHGCNKTARSCVLVWMAALNRSYGSEILKCVSSVANCDICGSTCEVQRLWRYVGLQTVTE